MVEFNPEHRAVLDGLFAGDPRVRAGKMFGFPAYYAGKKLCFCLYREGMGVKLPASTAARLLESDPQVIPFQPMGKHRMREWVQINASRSEAYRDYREVFEESIRHVLAGQETGENT